MGKLLFAIILVIATAPQSQASDKLTNIEIFQRCYVRMVRKVPKTLDALYQQVLKGQKKPEDACIALFDSAALGSNGIMTNSSSDDAREVLRTFNDLHLSWFKVKRSVGIFAQTYLIKDPDEPALYFTNAAMKANTNFSTVVTLNHGLRGVRSAADSGLSRWEQQSFFGYPGGWAFSNFNYYSLTYLERKMNGAALGPISPTKGWHVPDNALTETGTLIGIQPSKSITLPYFDGRFALPAGATPEEKLELHDVRLALAKSTTFNLNRHFGGGVMGSQMFLLNNYNMNRFALPKGVELINRRVTARIFEDLLCHQMPTLTGNDIKSEIKPKSPYSFQTQESCVRCHSSMDGLGSTLRNLYAFNTSGYPYKGIQEVGYPDYAFGTMPVKPGAASYAMQAPTGRLHFRELVGGITTDRDQQVNSLQQVGVYLSQYNDLYTCAAKRYYRFMTGIDVDVARVATKPLDKYHQTMVINLGKKLKSGQRVRQLLYDIFKSEPFRTRDYKTVVEK